ncbi:hypothetical protein [Streptomyces uncialis]|nr:hypothetical protein OG268_37035 [Streptomyces uncialis]
MTSTNEPAVPVPSPALDAELDARLTAAHHAVGEAVEHRTETERNS